MRRRCQRGHDIEGAAVPRANLLAAGDKAEFDHLLDSPLRCSLLLGRGEAGTDKAQQGLGEECVVIG
jgi:hypothetical protein